MKEVYVFRHGTVNEIWRFMQMIMERLYQDARYLRKFRKTSHHKEVMITACNRYFTPERGQMFYYRINEISHKILQDEVIFPASNASIVDLPEGRLSRSCRQ
jgi:hypothetical protein